VLIFRQWAHNEKLIYPLAELPEHLAGMGTGGESGIPSLFKTGLFWTGFAVSAGFLGWNMLCHTEAIPGLKPIDLRNVWYTYVDNTIFEPVGSRNRAEIFFTMIGLSFLIPKKISFSLWFFMIVYMVELLVLCWMGHGVAERSFPMEWFSEMNFRNGQGAGALIVFASVVLYKCRGYIFCCMRPGSISELDAAEQAELKGSSWAFLLGSAGIIVMLWQAMGANLFHTVFFYLVVLIITIGLVRCVTEGGILGFQAWSSPFHFLRNVTGMHRSWTAPPLFAPLMVYYTVLFLDIKTFIAPAMANALKIRNDLKMKRRDFHVAIFACILVSAVVAVAAELIMSYTQGADRMQSWFYEGLPKGTFYRMSTTTQYPPEALPEIAAWIGVGALAMAALLYFRQFLFWLPHPIGMIMLVNPIMTAYWFSIFLGWVAKSLVTKYGTKDTYARVRCLFLGLIVGELTIVALSMILTIWLGTRIPIDLNRNM